MGCPDDNALTEFMAGAMDEAAMRGIEAHLDACPGCRTTLVEFARCFHGAAGSKPDPERSLVDDGLTHGRYVPVRVLGTGRGLAYEGFDRRRQRPVTIHVILDADADRDRIDRDARVLSRLAHPNIVDVLDLEWRGGHAFVVTAAMKPGSFAAWLRGAPRSAADVVRVVVDAARGLSVAHDHGVVHRRVAPEAIVVERDGRVRVAYFVCEPAAASSRTDTRPGRRQARLQVGVRPTIAPEVRAGGEPSPAADQFGLSVVAADALAGIDGVPGSVAGVLQRGRSVGAARRFASMAAFGRALHRAGRPTTGPSPCPTTPSERGS